MEYCKARVLVHHDCGHLQMPAFSECFPGSFPGWLPGKVLGKVPKNSLRGVPMSTDSFPFTAASWHRMGRREGKEEENGIAPA